MLYPIRALLTLLTTLAVLVAPSAADGQTRSTGADIHGTVVDSSGARLPGVVVTARNQATGIARDVTSDGTGLYFIAALEPGDYEIAVTLAGFVAEPRQGVRLQVGDVLQVSFEMRPAGIEESVLVRASLPAVDVSQTTISTVVNEGEIDGLPINGRRFIDLAALAAGVTTGGPPDPAAETSGLSVLGQRPVSNGLLVDGLDNNDRVLGGATAHFPQESIREFQVQTASYPAEFGNAVGGIVNIVTRSGSNDLRGGVFLLYRDEYLNARNYFERYEPSGSPRDRDRAPFRQWQFGATLGGPLRRERTFFFTAVERSTARASNVVTIEPAVANVLQASGFSVERGDVPYDQNLGQVLTRLDHHHRPASTLSVRFQFSDALNENYAPFGGLVAKSRGARADRVDWGIAAGQTDVFRGRWVHEARAQLVRQRHEVAPNDPMGPAVTIVGAASVGRSDLYPTDRTNWTLQLKDTLTRAATSHTLKAGLELTRIDQQALLSYTFGGLFVFAGLPPIPGLLPAALSATEAFAAGLPALHVRGYGDGSSPFEYTEFSAFLQDDWRVTRRMTLKGGLRYQRHAFPDFDVTVSDVGGGSLTYPYPLSGGQLSPRVAAAFDPTGEGRTSLHAAYGLFFGEQLTAVYGVTNVFGRSDGTRLQVHPFPASILAWQQPGHALPEGVLPAPAVTITVAPDAATPRVQLVSAGVSRDLGAGLSASADFVYSRGSRQLGALEYNPLLPSLGPGRRPNDVGGIAGSSASVIQYTDFGETWYRGLLVSLRQTGMRHHFRASYTWARAEDNSSRFAGLVNDNGQGRNPADPYGLPVGFDPAREKGPAGTDQRHRIVVSGLWRLSAGVSLGGIVAASSGLPYTVLAGADLNGDGIPDADRARRSPVDPSSVLARNSERLPWQATVDLRVSRPVRVGPRAVLTPLVEIFNLFNRTNFSEINNVFGPGAFPDDPLRDAAGSITYGRYLQARAPRQVQLGVRVSF